MEKGQKLSDTARANSLGRKLEIIIIIALTLSYVTQGTKNSISVIGLVIILLSLWVPVIASYIVYKKNPESTAIRHIIGIGYGLFYVIVCIISEQRLVFAYAFPMVIVVSIFCDYLFSIIVSSTVIAIAITHAILFTVRTGFTPENIAAMEIEIAASLLVGIYSIISSKFIIDVNLRNIKSAQDAALKTENLLNDVMNVSNNLVEDVQLVSGQMTSLAASSTETLEAMTGVQDGSAETADAVHNQLVKTEEIQDQIAQVTIAADNIGGSVNKSVLAIQEGRENVEKLIGNAVNSEEAGHKAVEQLEALKDYTEQMGSIVALIQSVASSTNLLSLNASIEAARAGEAGRGFAVVAGEISNLASQTQSATADINDLIENLTSEVGNVTDAISALVESNKVQTESARVTADSFEKIAENTKTISSNSENLSQIVGTLDDANKEIISNIQTVSDITKEVSSHSATTCEKTEENEKIVLRVQSIVEEMTANARRLKEL